MKKNHWVMRLALLLLVSYTLLVVGVTAAGTAGSQSDPLVTVSYLNETFMTQLLNKVDEKLAARDKELSDKLSAQVAADTKRLREQYGGGTTEDTSSDTADTFTVVTLTEGQTLTGGIGCEVLLRVGTASCVAASAPGLVDETAGSTLGNGAALTVNHLYMMTVADRGVKATTTTVKLLVRGGYSIA